jgi:hypothetical protein
MSGVDEARPVRARRVVRRRDRVDDSVTWSGRTLIATLPSGRVAWLRLDPAVAQAGEVDQLRETARGAQERRAAALRSGRDALRALSSRVSADAERLTRARLDGDEALGRKLVDSNAKLDRRLSREVDRFHAGRDKVQDRHWLTARSVARRTLIDHLLIVSAAPLYAAFGRRTNPFAANNLALALLLGVWLVGDDIVDAVSGWKRRSGLFIRDTDLWSYIAPIANLLIGWLLLRRQQHERFTAGFAESFGDPAVTTALGRGLRSRELFFTFHQDIDLAEFVAPELVQDLVTFADVPAVASITAIEWAPGFVPDANARVVGLTAIVDRGVLSIEVTVAVSLRRSEPREAGAIASPVQSLRVAWIVDTRET